MEDDPHAFAITLEHDGERVTAVSAVAHRYPLTTCNGATVALQSVVGAPLSASIIELKRHADARRNCTHLFDLAALAIAHVFRAGQERVYRIEIPDEVDGLTEARLDRDHGRVLTWSLQHGVITAPARYAGQRVLGGFTSWAVANLAGEELEFALVLQRGYFVALSRIYDMQTRLDGAGLGGPDALGHLLLLQSGTGRTRLARARQPPRLQRHAGADAALVHPVRRRFGVGSASAEHSPAEAGPTNAMSG